MDIKAELEKTKGAQATLLARLQEIEKNKQAILQELLRLDGEVRLLSRMTETGGDK